MEDQIGSKRSRKQKQRDLKRSAVDIQDGAKKAPFSADSSLDDHDKVADLTTLPNSVNVVEFAKARAQEISILCKDIENAPFRGARRVFQQVPKSMRRRTASHNLKRLPTRLRQRALEELLKDGDAKQRSKSKPPCRRRRRRPRNIQLVNQARALSCSKQGDKSQWLETHIWHAKRAKMVDMWGYRIAQSPNEKCIKSCYRAHMSGSFLYDASYFQVVQIKETWPTIKQLLKSIMTIEEDIEMFASYNGVSVFTGEADMFAAHDNANVNNRNSGKRFSCSVKYIIRPAKSNDLHLLWLLVHPSVYSELLDNLGTSQFEAGDAIQLLQGQLNIYELYGTQRVELLESALGLPASSNASATVGEWLVADLRYSFPKQPKLAKPVQSIACSIWDAQYREQTVIDRKSEGQLNQLKSQSIIPGTPLDSDLESTQIPILVSSEGNGKAGLKTMLIVPKDWGRIVWRSLIFGGARFGGLSQLRRNLFEQKKPHFPHDYIFTTAHKTFDQLEAAKLLQKHLGRPPAKRINYEKFGIDPSNAISFYGTFGASGWFCPKKLFVSWLNLRCISERDQFITTYGTIETAYLLCSLDMQGRGVPEQFGLIYSSSSANNSVNTLCSSTDHLPHRQQSMEGGKDLTVGPPSNCMQDSDDRKVIGRVTFGSFSFASGRGSAIGIVKTDCFTSISVLETMLPVLIRNINSWHCYPANLTLL